MTVAVVTLLSRCWRLSASALAYTQRRAAQTRNGAAPVEDQSYGDILKDPEGDGDDAQ